MTLTTPVDAIVGYLKADPALAALVGTRIYQVHLPQSPTYPAIVVHSVAEPRSYHYRGPDNLARTRIQIDAYTSEHAGGNQKNVVDITAWTVEARLSGAPFQAGTPALAIRATVRTNKLDLYEAEDRLLRVMLEYLVVSRPSTGVAA